VVGGSSIGAPICVNPIGVGVTPSFKLKTERIPLCVPRSSFTQKVTNNEINSITSIYYIESYYENLLQVH
jgi:hypothetical protein